jgi:hypothetical protein
MTPRVTPETRLPSQPQGLGPFLSRLAGKHYSRRKRCLT